MKNVYSLLVLLFIISSCNFDKSLSLEIEPELACDGYFQKQTLKEIFLDQQKENLPSLSLYLEGMDKAYLEKFFEDHVEFRHIRTASIDQTIKKCECEAQLNFVLGAKLEEEMKDMALSNGKTLEGVEEVIAEFQGELPDINLFYTVQETSEGELYVETLELGEEVAGVIGNLYILETSIRKTLEQKRGNKLAHENSLVKLYEGMNACYTAKSSDGSVDYILEISIEDGVADGQLFENDERSTFQGDFHDLPELTAVRALLKPWSQGARKEEAIQISVNSNGEMEVQFFDSGVAIPFGKVDCNEVFTI